MTAILTRFDILLKFLLIQFVYNFLIGGIRIFLFLSYFGQELNENSKKHHTDA